MPGRREVHISTAGFWRGASHPERGRARIMRINPPEIRSVVDVFHLSALRFTTKVVE